MCWEGDWGVLGVIWREYKIAWFKLGEGHGDLEGLRRSLKDVREGGMRFQGSWWALGGSLRVLGVTGRDVSEKEGLEEDRGWETRGWNEVGCAGKKWMLPAARC